MAAAQTTVVIVNWNGASYLDQLIQSIQQEAPAQIVVVDNNSTDGSIAILKKFADVDVIENTENRGFGAAANQGIAVAETSNVLILNVDVYAMPGSITTLERFLAETSDAGAVAPRLSFPNGSLQLSCRNFPTPFTLFLYLSFLDRIFPSKYRLRAKDHQSTRSVEQPMGAAIMIRKKVLDQIGGFDETFFLYMEDVDLSKELSAKVGKFITILRLNLFMMPVEVRARIGIARKEILFGMRNCILKRKDISRFWLELLLVWLLLSVRLFIFSPVTYIV